MEWGSEEHLNYLKEHAKKENCVNCGNEYAPGTGYPKENKRKWECCCSLECWCEFNGTEEKPVFIDYED